MSGNQYLLTESAYPDASGAWYYEPASYQPYRFLLGPAGQRPLICVGINPSTAQPSALDNTLKSVDRIARNNGYDSWLVFNVYPQRATNPNDMHHTPNPEWHRQNMAWLAAVLREKPGATLWAAWGTLIEKRPYLWDYMHQMASIALDHGTPWVSFGKRSKAGHPHHPLYLAQISQPQDFPISEYLDTCRPRQGKKQTAASLPEE